MRAIVEGMNARSDDEDHKRPDAIDSTNQSI